MVGLTDGLTVGGLVGVGAASTTDK
jgi:hypothetical protein